MNIKFLITPEWLFEWFWSLVKLHAFQWPHKLIACQIDSSNTKSGKLQKLGAGQKIGGEVDTSPHTMTLALSKKITLLASMKAL